MGQHHPRPSLEDPGHPHHNVYLVYHSATILRTVYHGQELYPAPCRGNVTSCQTGAVSVQLMHASLLLDTCISADHSSLLMMHLYYAYIHLYCRSVCGVASNSHTTPPAHCAPLHLISFCR